MSNHARSDPLNGKLACAKDLEAVSCPTVGACSMLSYFVGVVDLKLILG